MQSIRLLPEPRRTRAARAVNGCIDLSIFDLNGHSRQLGRLPERWPARSRRHAKSPAWRLAGGASCRQRRVGRSHSAYRTVADSGRRAPHRVPRLETRKPHSSCQQRCQRAKLAYFSGVRLRWTSDLLPAFISATLGGGNGKSSTLSSCSLGAAGLHPRRSDAGGS